MNDDTVYKAGAVFELSNGCLFVLIQSNEGRGSMNFMNLSSCHTLCNPVTVAGYNPECLTKQRFANLFGETIRFVGYMSDLIIHIEDGLGAKEEKT